jgi:hypothetical protein
MQSNRCTWKVTKDTPLANVLEKTYPPESRRQEALTACSTKPFPERLIAQVEPMDQEVAQRIWRISMAQVIEFYTPTHFRPEVKWPTQEEHGQVIAFISHKEHSAEIVCGSADERLNSKPSI